MGGRKGFGFVEPDQEISWGDVNSGEGLFFKRDSFITVNAGKGMMLRVPDGMRVSFKVYKDKKGLGACEIQRRIRPQLRANQEKKRSRAGEESESVKVATVTRKQRRRLRRPRRNSLKSVRLTKKRPVTLVLLSIIILKRSSVF